MEQRDYKTVGEKNVEKSVENPFFFFSGLVVIIHCRAAAAVFQFMDDDVKQILMFYQVQVIIHMCEGLIPFVS